MVQSVLNESGAYCWRVSARPWQARGSRAGLGQSGVFFESRTTEPPARGNTNERWSVKLFI